MTTELVAPIDVQIELTERCNMRCRHCYNYWRSNGIGLADSRQLKLDEIRHIVEMLARHQIPSITITGGEPFICKEEVFLLLELAAKAGIRATINSNFSQLTEADFQRLANREPVIPVLVSLLSADERVFEEITGLGPAVHDRIIHNIGRGVELGIPISVNMVLLPQNVATLRATAMLAKGLGVRTFCATKALPNSSHPDQGLMLTGKEIVQSVEELLRVEQDLHLPVEILGCYPKCLLYGTDGFAKFFHRTCYAGVTTMTIGADGSVRPCSHVEQSYGNILHESLPEIWGRLAEWRGATFLPEECSGCVLLASCRGGCRVNNLQSCLTSSDMHALPDRKHQLRFDEPPKPTDNGSKMVDDAFIVNPKARFRTEAFGAMISILDRASITLVNHSAAAFLSQAQRQSAIISETMFLEKSGATNETERRIVQSLFQKLVRRDVLVPSPPKQER